MENNKKEDSNSEQGEGKASYRPILGIALTSRDKKGDPLPLAGVPHHAVEGYLKRLVAQGFSVAIAEQMEPAEGAKGIVDRQVVEVVTPGTVTRLGLLESSESNYIVALLLGESRAGVAVAEVSTGEFRVGEVPLDEVASLLLEYPPRELLFPVLLLPAVVPVLLSSVSATQTVLAGQPLGEAAPWLKLLAAADLVYLVVGVVTFDDHPAVFLQLRRFETLEQRLGQTLDQA